MSLSSTWILRDNVISMCLMNTLRLYLFILNYIFHYSKHIKTSSFNSSRKVYIFCLYNEHSFCHTKRLHRFDVIVRSYAANHIPQYLHTTFAISTAQHAYFPAALSTPSRTRQQHCGKYCLGMQIINVYFDVLRDAHKHTHN